MCISSPLVISQDIGLCSQCYMYKFAVVSSWVKLSPFPFTWTGILHFLSITSKSWGENECARGKQIRKRCNTRTTVENE